MTPASAVTFAEWRAVPGEVWRVRISTFKDRPLVDVRVFYRGKGGDFLPTKKGVALGVAHLAELVDGLSLALEYARAHELVGPPDTEWK
mgnify:CR=1 FL=1